MPLFFTVFSITESSAIGSKFCAGFNRPFTVTPTLPCVVSFIYTHHKAHNIPMGKKKVLVSPNPHTHFLNQDGLLTGSFLNSWWPPSLFTCGVLWGLNSNVTKFKHTAQHIMLVLMLVCKNAYPVNERRMATVYTRWFSWSLKWRSRKTHTLLSCFLCLAQFYRAPVLAAGVWNVKHFLYYGRVDKEDEMTCLIKGCNFVLKNIPHEAFVYAKHADSEFRFQTTQPDIFPYLLVNIGSGVSIVKVTTSLFSSCYVDQSVYILAIIQLTFISWLIQRYIILRAGDTRGYASAILKKGCWQNMTWLNGETRQLRAGSDEIDDKHIFKQDHWCPQLAQDTLKRYNNCKRSYCRGHVGLQPDPFATATSGFGAVK